MSLGKLRLPTAGGPHANLAAEYVGIFQKTLGSTLTCCYVLPRVHTQRESEIAYEWINKTVRRSGFEGTVEKKIIEGDSIASALANAASDYDLLVLGASKEGVFSSVLFGEIPEKVARHSDKPVMIVKRYEGAVKSVIKRILG